MRKPFVSVCGTFYIRFFSSALFSIHFYASSYALSFFSPFRCQWIFGDFATAQSCVNIHNLNCSINQFRKKTKSTRMRRKNMDERERKGKRGKENKIPEGSISSCYFRQACSQGDWLRSRKFRKFSSFWYHKKDPMTFLFDSLTFLFKM